MRSSVGDAHGSSSRIGPSTSSICLRVLMHTADWQRVSPNCAVCPSGGHHRLSVGEQRRAAGVDRPPAARMRRRAHRAVSRVQQTRRSRARWRGRASASAPCIGSSCCRSASTKCLDPRRFTSCIRRRARPIRPAALFGSPVTLVAERCVVLVTGATGFTGGHLARTLAAAGHECARSSRRSRPRRLAILDRRRRGSSVVPGDLRDRRPSAAAMQGIEVVYHIAAIYRQAGLPTETIAPSTPSPFATSSKQAARAGVRRVVHCSTVGVHGDIEHPPANEDAPLKPGDVYQGTKLEGEELAREAGGALRHRGHHRPPERHLRPRRSPAAEAVPEHRAPAFRFGPRRIYYHLTYIDDLVEGFRLCGEHPAAANRTYILAGGEVTTLNELVTAHRRRRRRAAASAAPAGVAVLGGRRRLRSGVRPARIEPPIYRRRVDFFTKSRAFDITRARTEIGYAPQVGCARALPGPCTGIANMAGSERSPDPASVGPRADRESPGSAVCGHVEPREVRRARHRAAGPGGAAEARTDRDDGAGAAGRFGLALRNGSIRCCSAPAGATSCSGRTSSFAIRTRFTSAATS